MSVLRANVEIKARVRDPRELRRRALELAERRVGLDEQTDTYFRVPRGRLKLRESLLSGGQLVPYLREDAPGPRRAEYRVVPVEEPESLRALLATLLGVHRVVRKRREILLVGNVRIHLDQVEGLGHFMELEAVQDGSPAALGDQAAKLHELMAKLGVDEADLVPVSYEALVDAAPE